MRFWVSVGFVATPGSAGTGGTAVEGTSWPRSLTGCGAVVFGSGGKTPTPAGRNTPAGAGPRIECPASPDDGTPAAADGPDGNCGGGTFVSRPPAKRGACREALCGAGFGKAAAGAECPALDCTGLRQPGSGAEVTSEPRGMIMRPSEEPAASSCPATNPTGKLIEIAAAETARPDRRDRLERC